MLPGDIHVCIFDVNGVLIDSNAANAQAMSEAFTGDPRLQKRIAELYMTLTGIDRGAKIRIVQEKIIQRPFEEKEFELRWSRFTELGQTSMMNAPVMGGATRILAELGRRKIRRAALSNTPLDVLHKILEARELATHLDIIRGGGDWPKAHSLVRLLRELGFNPRECLFFGDGKGDLAAARHAGVPFVAIDPGTGEFSGEQGIQGPFHDLAAWGRHALALTTMNPS